MLKPNRSRLVLGSIVMVMAMAWGVYFVLTDTPREVIAAERMPLENLLAEELEHSDAVLTIRPEVSEDGQQVRFWIGYHLDATTDDEQKPSLPFHSKTTNVIVDTESTLVLGLMFDGSSMRAALHEKQDDGV